MQTIKEFGDLLERNNFNLLSQISNYETIWATYIGNNGLAQPIEIKNIDLEKDNKRKLIWQENYSIFRNLLILERIKNQVEKVPNELYSNVNNEAKSKYLADKLLTFESQLLQAVFIIYNSIELFNKILENLKDEKVAGKKNSSDKKDDKTTCNENQILVQGEFSKNYSDFLNLRHWVTHNVRIIYVLHEEEYLLPSNLNIFAKPNDKNEGYLWENLRILSKDEFQPLSNFIHSFYEKILSDFKNVLKKELIFFEKREYPKIIPINNLPDYGNSVNMVSASFLSN